MNNSWSWKSCPICVGSVPSRKFVERSLSLKREREREGGGKKKREQKISWKRENHEIISSNSSYFLSLSLSLFQNLSKMRKILQNC